MDRNQFKSFQCLTSVLLEYGLLKEIIFEIDNYWNGARYIIVGGWGNGQRETQIGLLDYDYGYEGLPLKLPDCRWNAHLSWDKQSRILVFGGRNSDDQSILGEYMAIRLLPTEIIDLKHKTITRKESDKVVAKLERFENLKRPLVSTTRDDYRVVLEQTHIFIFRGDVHLKTWVSPNCILTRSGCVIANSFVFFIMDRGDGYSLEALHLETQSNVTVTLSTRIFYVSAETHLFDNIIFHEELKRHDNGNQPVVMLSTVEINPKLKFVYYSQKTNEFMIMDYHIKIQPIENWNGTLLSRSVFFKSGRDVWFSDTERPDSAFGADWFLYQVELPRVLDFSLKPHRGAIYVDKADLQCSSTLVACPEPVSSRCRYQDFEMSAELSAEFLKLHPVAQMAWFHGDSGGGFLAWMK
jgi:hypothetical protein